MNDADLDRHLAALKASVADASPPTATDVAIAAAIAASRRAAAGSGPAGAAPGTIPTGAIGAGPQALQPSGAAGHPGRSAGERWLAWPLALAASIAVLSFIVRSVPPAAVVPEAAAGVSDAAAFMPVVPLADIAQAGDALVVPARVPRTMLAALGLPIDPARAADAVDAELLVRADGAVLAVRFVY